MYLSHAFFSIMIQSFFTEIQPIENGTKKSRFLGVPLILSTKYDKQKMFNASLWPPWFSLIIPDLESGFLIALLAQVIFIYPKLTKNWRNINQE